jgi:hypothetical protein
MKCGDGGTIFFVPHFCNHTIPVFLYNNFSHLQLAVFEATYIMYSAES